MAFVTATTNGPGRRFFEQVIEIPAGGERLGNLLETLGVVGKRAVARVRLIQRTDLSIHPCRFTRLHGHFTTVGKLQRNQARVICNNAFTFANNVAHFEAAQLARGVTGECFAGEGSYLGNDLGLGHVATPDTMKDFRSVWRPRKRRYCTKVQPGTMAVNYFTSAIKVPVR